VRSWRPRHEFTLTLSSSHDLASTLQHVTDAGARLTGADRCRLGLLETGRHLPDRGRHGGHRRGRHGLDLAIGGWIMRSGQAAWMPDMELGLTEPPELAQLARRREGSALGVPLRGRTGEVIGFGSLHHQRDRRALGVLFCDLDDFKHVNDSFGHTTGDALLTQVSDRLRRTLPCRRHARALAWR